MADPLGAAGFKNCGKNITAVGLLALTNGPYR